MRRGHAGNGGWRNENSRQFRPRPGGPPHFRPPPRNFPLFDSPRFQAIGPRLPRLTQPFNQNEAIADHQDRNKYRLNNRQIQNQYRSHDRNHQRPNFPLFDRYRHKDMIDHGSPYKDNKYYDSTPADHCHINMMGDIDHRHQGNGINEPDVYSRRPNTPWNNTAEGKKQFYDDRNQYYAHNDSVDNKRSLLEYTGHRPPSSDHYGGSKSSSIDNSNSFSRSVDDTVDIVRKRLQNRSEPNDSQTTGESLADPQDEDLRVPNSLSGTHQRIQHDSTTKKRRQKNAENNCNKMKNKIVHELFKMDKDRILKLMDNPNSSTKFEYAVSSLITESQNSLNKHLRSVAEKSLTSSDDFIHNDNNTIYEDTFMKQMQNILEPQDTVLLEDIKPLVLAELSKVLQLNEYDQPFQLVDDLQHCNTSLQDTQNYDNYEASCSQNYEDYSRVSLYNDLSTPPVGYEDYVNSNICYDQLEEEVKPLFERRVVPHKEPSQEPQFSPIEHQHIRRTSQDTSPKDKYPLISEEIRISRRSIDRRHSEDKNKESGVPVPLFTGTNNDTDQLSEEDDPFAELDKQYHVAVDHNFIETYDVASPHQTTNSETNESNDFERRTPIKENRNMQNHYTTTQKSPMQLPFLESSFTTPTNTNETSSPRVCIKKESSITPIKVKPHNELVGSNIRIKKEAHAESKTLNSHSERSQNDETSSKAVTPSSSRKRSIDQKPSHRKEKRKKSESDSSQQIHNKNAIINDNSSKDDEKCNENTKSIINMFFSKNQKSKEVPKDMKKVESVDKSYSDKYVKRKEPEKKTKEKEDKQKKRKRSVSSSHSTVSPKDSLNNNTQNKTECNKTKLQSIDMFLEQPKKSVNKHQAHRNTALSPNTPTKINKGKQSVITFNKKMTKKHVATQMFKKTHVKETQTFESKCFSSRFCQTEKKKMLGKAIQTDPVIFEKKVTKATDAFERMKEIDMEIQNLLQEKFKLYSSLESNASMPSTIQTLGMTVLNVPLNEDTHTEEIHSENSGDAIIDDFTSIPVEELENIALETIIEQPETSQSGKKSRRHKMLQKSRENSASPTAVKRNARKSSKALNISLLEQIISDDRPIEDIISLDELETTPVKSKKKPVKLNKKKTYKNSKVDNALLANVAEHTIKECYVALVREDFSQFIKPNTANELSEPEVLTVIPELPSKLDVSLEKVDVQPCTETNVVEETVVVNDLQLDMLDVSEDIVIGEMCEMKFEDKEAEKAEVVVTEEVIVDNSLVTEPEQHEPVPEEMCKMFDYSTDENLRRDAITVTGHADAVLAIECIENNFVVACLDGNVYHFSGDGRLLTTLRGSNLAVTCITIVKEKDGTTVYTGSLDSRIRYYDLETGMEKGPECNVLSPIQTMDRAWDTIFVGTRTGFVLQFECKNNMLIPVSTVKFSDQSILALRALKEGPRKVLLVAARSEDVTIKDAQTGLLLRSLQGPKMTVYTLLYEDGKIYCGTSSHQIHVFDYTSGSHIGAHEGGKGAVCLRASGGLVFAGCYDGCVYVYREGEPRALAQLRGPGLMLLSLALQGTKIIAGYKDRSLYIWKIPLSILQEMIL